MYFFLAINILLTTYLFEDNKYWYVAMHRDVSQMSYSQVCEELRYLDTLDKPNAARKESLTNKLREVYNSRVGDFDARGCRK